MDYFITKGRRWMDELMGSVDCRGIVAVGGIELCCTGRGASQTSNLALWAGESRENKLVNQALGRAKAHRYLTARANMAACSCMARRVSGRRSTEGDSSRTCYE